jgi:hypothetical protein
LVGNNDDDDNAPVFLITVDGVHCRVCEPKHPIQSKNPRFYSHKFNQAGVDYELGISVYHNALVWMNGPFPAGDHDINVFCSKGLKAKIPTGKEAIGDNGYRGEEAIIFQPNYESSKVVLDPATSLSMLSSRPFSALTCDSAMALKSTGWLLRQFASSVNTRWRMTLLCSVFRVV